MVRCLGHTRPPAWVAQPGTPTPTTVMNAHTLTHNNSHTSPAGSPEPLGPSRQGSAINFAVYAHAATGMSLVLHKPDDGSRQEVPMNKSGGWLQQTAAVGAVCFQSATGMSATTPVN